MITPSLLPKGTLQAAGQRWETQSPSSRELRKQRSEFREVEAARICRSSGKEETAQRKSSGDLNRVLFYSLTDYWFMYLSSKTSGGLRKNIGN